MGYIASEEFMSRSDGSAVSSTVVLLMVAADINTEDVCIILIGGRGLKSSLHKHRLFRSVKAYLYERFFQVSSNPAKDTALGFSEEWIVKHTAFSLRDIATLWSFNCACWKSNLSNVYFIVETELKKSVLSCHNYRHHYIFRTACMSFSWWLFVVLQMSEMDGVSVW